MHLHIQQKKNDQRTSVAVSRVLESKLPLIYLNRVGGQDELVFDGASFCLNEQGKLKVQLKDFEEQVLKIELNKKENSWIIEDNIERVSSRTESLYKSLVLSVRDYVLNNGFPGVVLGMSGGIDSALVAAIATDALGPNLVKAVMMPSPFTSKESLEDAKLASSNLGIEYSFIEIENGMNTIDKILNDFYLLTQCKYFIVGPSTFSWWGAWLSNNQNKICIRPKNINPSNNIDFWPESWITI